MLPVCDRSHLPMHLMNAFLVGIMESIPTYPFGQRPLDARHRYVVDSDNDDDKCVATMGYKK